MRTTVTLDQDVAAAAQRLRAERNISLSAAVNELARSGLSAGPPRRTPFVQQTYEMGSGIDVSNVGDALEILEGPDAR